MRQHKRLWLVFCVLLMAGTITVLAQTTLASFGLSDTEVKSHVVSGLFDGYPSFYPNRKAFNAASGSMRAALVRNVLTVIKTYTESAAFQSEYARRRAEAKPAPAVAAKGSPDDQYAQYLASQQKSLAEMKANVAKMPPDTQKQMAPMIKQMEESIAKQASDPQMASMMKQGFAAQATAGQKTYQQDLAKYEQQYPADPKILIANRLHQFLDLTKDIPFDAKLVSESGGTKVFADPQLQAKPDQWKMCFRAGKEPVEAARAFATAWLKQLGK